MKIRGRAFITDATGKATDAAAHTPLRHFRRHDILAAEYHAWPICGGWARLSRARRRCRRTAFLKMGHDDAQKGRRRKNAKQSAAEKCLAPISMPDGRYQK